MTLQNLHDLPALHPEITYQLAAPEQHGPRPTPFLLTGPIPEQFDDWYFNDQWTPAAGLFTIPNLHLAGDATLTWQNLTLTIPQNEVDENAITREAPMVAAVTTHRTIAGQVVLLPGAAYRIYGHWLADFLPRLHILTICGHDIKTLKYLLPAAMPPYAAAWFALLGIPPENILHYDITTESCAIESALIPTNLRGHSCANPIFAEAARALAEPVPVSTALATPKIYLSRRKWARPTRRLTNVEAIERIFQNHGFDIIHPETLTIPAQITLFRGAKIIAGEYGSALHNAMFAPPGATVLALRGTLPHPWFLQSGLCAAMAQNCGYIFGKAEMFLGNQVFWVDPDDVHTALEVASKNFSF
jgi:capsular polysaccharide biosynthesis protein